MIKKLIYFLPILAVISCSEPQARRPVSHSSGTFMKESIERNKLLVAGEEDDIEAIIKQDTVNTYQASKKGYWYTYLQRNTSDTLTPKKGDIAYFDYEIKDIQGSVIYSQLELRPQEYYIDKEQKIIMGLRDGIKLMRKNEIVTFLFPSHMAYGYHGDNRRIGENKPLIITVTLRDFTPEPSTSDD